ncbi:MerR family transcriptional regulator [bacterium]|jgi:DNA-binding transcriptional MerR regulator|nr:MerR family transcriptional regulator [bacterium]
MKSHTLLEVSKITGIKLNALRYHLRKLEPLFEHLKRDRYNRFRLMSHDIQRLQQIHDMKNQGYDYAEIKIRLGGDSANLQTKDSTDTQSSTRLHKMERALETQHQSIQQLEQKMNSLEERLEMLVDMHTKLILEIP